MILWDPGRMLLRMYNARAKLDEAAMGFEAGGVLTQAQPRYGVPIEVGEMFLHLLCFQNVTTERSPNRRKVARLVMRWS